MVIWFLGGVSYWVCACSVVDLLFMLTGIEFERNRGDMHCNFLSHYLNPQAAHCRRSNRARSSLHA